MNIFALSKCPVESAEQMLDKHVVKMPTETCQMLHTNLLYFMYKAKFSREPSLRDLKVFYRIRSNKVQHLMKPAMLNHPSTIWARQSRLNFLWLYSHGFALCDEYTYRYGKTHGSYDRIHDCESYVELVNTHDFPISGLTPVTIAMDNSYRLDKEEYSQRNPNWAGWDFVIDSYQHYYLEGKWRFAEWKKDRMPQWWPSNWYAKKYNVGVRAYNAKKPKYPQTLMEE